MAQCEFIQPQFGIQFLGQPHHFSWKNQSLTGNIPIGTSKQYSTLFANCSMDSSTWLEAQIFLEFNPSSANYIDILFHFDSILINGWILRVGDTEDGIKLIQRKKSTDFTVLKGESGHFNKTKSNIQIRIVKQPQQIIVLYKDSSWEQFKCLGAAIDTMPLNQKYHGLGILQTGNGAAGKQIFKSFYVGPPRPDKSPPVLEQIHWLNPSWVQLQFSEPVFIENRNQIICEFEKADTFFSPQSNTILAKFLPRKCNKNITVYIQNIKDSASNIQALQQQSALLECETPILPYQITISEIMSDPNPSLGYLPSSQYIELKNNTNQAMWLNELTLSDAQTKIQLPKHLLAAQNRIVLCALNDTQLSQRFPNTLQCKLPYINIEYDKLSLTNRKNECIHELHFHNFMHHPSFSGGGYSLEHTDTLQPCLDPFLWESNSELGGTPGTRHSITAPFPTPRFPIPDPNTPFRIFYIGAPQSDTLKIFCNHAVHAQTPPNVRAVDTSQKIQFQFVGNSNNTIAHPQIANATWIYTIEPPLKVNEIVNLQINNALDCNNNTLQDTIIAATFCSSPPMPGEIKFNEIMFNALDELPDYIEITNISNRPIQLQGMQLQVIKPQQTPDIFFLNPQPHVLYPKELLCYSINPYLIARSYNPSAWKNHYWVPNFPNLPATEATLKLTHNHQSPIDQMTYTDAMHTPTLLTTKGVSLEKTSITAPSNIALHWVSATSTVGNATPGETNSQIHSASTRKFNNQKPFSLQKNHYLINGDDPIVLIHHFSKPGFIVTATLFTMHGMAISTPCRLVQVSEKGQILIPTNEYKNLIPSGNYLLHVEAFHPDADLCSQNLRIILVQQP